MLLCWAPGIQAETDSMGEAKWAGSLGDWRVGGLVVSQRALLEEAPWPLALQPDLEGQETVPR